MTANYVALWDIENIRSATIKTTYIGSLTPDELKRMPFGKALAALRDAEHLPTDASGLTIRDDVQFLSRSEITMIESVFQHRTASEDDYEREQHLRQLTNALDRMPCGKKMLDPILVKQVDFYWLCVDGHHRLTAYKARGVDLIPVEEFTGSIDEAIEVAGAENLKAKLPLAGRDRYNLAWRLTAAQIGSKRSVVEKTGVSDGLVAKMRRLRKELTEKDFKPENLTYGEAQDAIAGRLGERGGDEWIDQMVANFENKLKHALGKNVHRNRVLVANALDNLYPSLTETIIEDNAICYRPQIETIFKEHDEEIID